MRQPKFRGFSQKENKWFYGCGAFGPGINDEAYIVNTEEIGIKCIEIEDPNTICQFTGLTDKNKKEIFEGDIVKLDEYFAKAQGYSSTISEVAWDEDGALFDTPKIQYALSQHNSKYFTVIGNIFETPQLI